MRAPRPRRSTPRIALLLVGLAVAGCGAGVLPAIHSEEERLAVARRLIDQGEYVTASELLRTYVANNAGSADVDQAIYLLGHDLSVASIVGFIALAGVAAEFGVVMLLYLKQAIGRSEPGRLLEAIDEGAVQRVRPKAMTVAVILGGLAPIMWSAGTGSEVMQRIAAPMIGGMITAPLLSMFVIPAAYVLMRRRRRGIKVEVA